MRFQPGGGGGSRGENVGDREADILGLTPETFSDSPGTFGPMSSPPSGRGGLFLLAGEPVRNSDSRGQDHAPQAFYNGFIVCNRGVCGKRDTQVAMMIVSIA